MILLRILDHDLHTSRNRSESTPPLWVEHPARQGFLPALVSSSRGKFLVARKLVDDLYIRAGVFEWDSDRLDDLIGGFCAAALDLSRSEGWGNVFAGRAPARRAFDYILEESGMDGQPHVCLVPDSWSHGLISRFFGRKNLSENGMKYRERCRVVPCKAGLPVFLSRPDMVGMYTQFLGGRSCILLHNVRRGMTFCPEA